ncbi:unnamed protein product [Caenorhabditis auriculariae]|uniref:Uncharacterized protein n=1 Tax=Caenorhabditis auriculariae TaxID=2777116 RepID=A0A8S1HJY0_9PELO|nr:unnamed protein product [Caenorhabditis auriculariae]
MRKGPGDSDYSSERSYIRTKGEDPEKTKQKKGEKPAKEQDYKKSKVRRILSQRREEVSPKTAVSERPEAQCVGLSEDLGDIILLPSPNLSLMRENKRRARESVCDVGSPEIDCRTSEDSLYNVPSVAIDNATTMKSVRIVGTPFPYAHDDERPTVKSSSDFPLKIPRPSEYSSETLQDRSCYMNSDALTSSSK